MGSKHLCFIEKLKSTKRKTLKWNKENFKDIFYNKGYWKRDESFEYVGNGEWDGLRLRGKMNEWLGLIGKNKKSQRFHFHGENKRI